MRTATSLAVLLRAWLGMRAVRCASPASLARASAAVVALSQANAV